MDFRDSKTYQNVLKTMEGEMKASATYAIYAAKARDDGYQQIGNIFDETSGNEREHAEIFMKLLNGGSVPDTLTNLKKAYSGENNEWTKMYLEFANQAREEGYEQIAKLYEGIIEIEKHHDFRFRTLAENIENNEVFCKDKPALWICLNCGALYWGICAPKKCPVCGYDQGYYELNCENY